ncbi:MAG: energy-coupling factor transporter ATPase [Eubacteriaceae bacterium]|jgi:energy-coupling factor transport system ATP-binding protein|nr:energy-coupling factor transporter ATPase [Eubacteriaceae bacterium]
MQKAIEIKNLQYKYSRDEEEIIAIYNMSLDIYEGEFVGIIGHNGSGKSTLAKLINGIIMPTAGDIFVYGMNTKDEEKIWEIRQKAGIVFQNPDNQIVATIVEEDVAFGPENLGVEPGEIRRRVDDSLEIVHMSEFKDRKPHQLSGGQKQRIAIAGILAMEPRCIIFDEATAMLDPSGREEVLECIKQLNKENNTTVVYITHYMEEIVDADRIIVLNQGDILMQGSPKEIFARVEELQEVFLDVPNITHLAYELKKEGLAIPDGILTVDELVENLCQSS